MSMSSMIEDLPGPQEEDIPQEFQDQPQPHSNHPTHPSHHNSRHIPQHQPQQEDQYQEPEMFTQPIEGSINKKTSGVFTQIKNEVNIYNILLIIILYIACMPESNDLIRRLLLNFTSVGYSHTIITIIKCILLVVVFIIIKKVVGKNTILL